MDNLDFKNILINLSKYCITYIGKELALNLKPSSNLSVVKSTLAETQEAVDMSYRNSTPDFIEIDNIETYLKIINASGVLSKKALLNIANILKLANDLKSYIDKDFLHDNEFPQLTNLFTKLYTNKQICERIYTSIQDENTILDDASENLKTIRTNIRSIETNIKNTLHEITKTPTFSKYLQENIITIRNDRYVVPVKEEHRKNIKGFVHDISNGGATLFIEPTSIFELNNTLNSLKLEEEVEIEKILKTLTLMLEPYTEELENDVNIIGHLDFIFAKAKYSKELKAITPKINNNKEINLINARHPLIDKNVVVPISINIGNDFSVLVITGPNTGGKTVALKTIGLLETMACSGLNIPADENSSIYVFDNIFSDIGDSQSIADSLSTFSSHMTNIVDIIEKNNGNSLILLDELGSGTDPVEGASLAISILETLKNSGSLIVATTHYQELKKYCLTNDGFENASVEFDLETLSPTYKLLVGIPGKSNAFEISQKLGLNSSIIENAKSLIDKNDTDFENLLKNVYNQKSKLEKEREEISNNLIEIEKLKSSLEDKNNQINSKENDIINKAKLQARNILLDAKEDANEIIKKMSSKNLSNKDLEKLRSTLNESIKKVNNISNNQNPNTSINNNIIPDSIKRNDKVYVINLSQYGTVLSNVSKSNDVQVQIGSIKMNVNISNLRKLSNSEFNSFAPKSNIASNTNSSISKTRNIKSEINVIGLNVEEAIPIVDKFLDDCSLSKLDTCRIVHGKGTGKLRNGIHSFLKKHPHVNSYRMGTFGEGEMGATVVELK